MTNRIPKIGIFDSGLGGLTVLREVRRAVPEAELVYLGDTARTPYGSKSVSTIQAYARECAHFLRSCEIDLLVVACNTVSATSLQELEREMPFPVIGTIEPAVRVARTHSHGGTIAVIGTDATIASGVYDRALKSSMPGAQVLSFACPLFVPLVEQGMFEGEIVEKVIELYLGRITAASVESLVLGCTHYPLLRPAMESFLGGRIRIIECSTAVAEACRLTCVSLADSPDWARSAEEPRTSEKSKQMTTDGSTQDRTNATYFVTDTPSRFNFFARNFLGDELLSARVVELSSP